MQPYKQWGEEKDKGEAEDEHRATVSAVSDDEKLAASAAEWLEMESMPQQQQQQQESEDDKWLDEDGWPSAPSDVLATQAVQESVRGAAPVSKHIVKQPAPGTAVT